MMWSKYILRLLSPVLLFSLVWLSACSNIQPSVLQPGEIPSFYYQELPPQWSVQGKIALVDTLDNEGLQAYFNWIHKYAYDKLRFSGPLGKSLLTIEHKKQNGYYLNQLQVDGKRYQGNGTLEDFLAQYVDYDMPLNALPYWLFGQLAPDLPLYQVEVQAHPPGMLQTLHQGKWQIQFSRPSQYHTYWFNRKIILHNDRFNIKILIRQMAIPTPLISLLELPNH